MLVMGIHLFLLPIETKAGKKLDIAVVYMTSNNLPNENVFLWEATFSAFDEGIQLFDVHEVEVEKILEFDVLVFIGEQKGEIPRKFRESVKDFTGITIAFGYNSTQLVPYQDWEIKGEEGMRELDGELLPVVQQIVHMVPPKEAEVLAVANTLNGQLPFIVQNGPHAYIASTTIGQAEKFAVSRAIYTLLNIEVPQQHPAYIQLVDISPISSPKIVQEAGAYLIQRGIPFYLAITPVYVNHETGERMLLSENNELVEVLQELQAKGGMIIAHGYENVYRLGNSSEDAEFWDLAYDQKITTHNIEVLVSPIKSLSSFTSKKAYETYLKNLDEVEASYIAKKEEMAIENLVENELYPLAFKVPNYAMSSNGYHVTANYFTSIFGYLQLSDTNWKVTNTPLFISNPVITGGMILYPETVGFVNSELEDPLEDIKNSVNQLKTVPGAVLGGAYPSEITPKELKEIIDFIEGIGPVDWLDLRETSQYVQTNHIEIKQEVGKPIQILSTITNNDALVKRIKNQPFEAALWGMVLVVVLFILAFLTYISTLRLRLRRRLFEEREHNG